jgi:type II secretory pathway pseudopilin PulG
MNRERALRLKRQRGFVLLLVVLAMLAILGTVFLSGMAQNSSVTGNAVSRSATSSDELSRYRDALIGYAIGAIASSSRPGTMPVPDTRQNGAYDGASESPLSCLDSSKAEGLPAITSGVAQLSCLGKAPWKTLGLSLTGVSGTDSTGVVPWYAVSQNLVSIACMSVLNPGTVSGTPTAFNCAAAPAWPWIKVCDAAGRVISDRVAFVLILPGLPVATEGRTQSRAAASGPRDYLDAIPTPAGWSTLPVNQRCSTFDNAAMSGEFVIGTPSASFNDRIMFVTIDDLFEKVEQRVANEVREAIISYKSFPNAGTGTYPWLVALGNPSLSGASDSPIATPNTSAGFVPYHTNVSQFKTELSWQLSGAGVSGSTSSLNAASSQFDCTVLGVAKQCRLRTLANATISNTLPATALASHLTGVVSSPIVSCDRDATYDDRALNCANVEASSVYASTTSYLVQFRTCCTGAWTTFGALAGDVRIGVELNMTIPGTVVPSWSPPNGNLSGPFTLRRALSKSMDTSTLLAVTERWYPTGGTVAAVNKGALIGEVVSAGIGLVTVSNIRRYPVLPDWYQNDKWYEFIYAAISPDSLPSLGSPPCSAACLSVGSRSNLDLVVVSVGAPLGAPAGPSMTGQNRYSGTPSGADFLESSNATGVVTRAFASSDQKRTATYADTISTIPR